MCSSGTGRFIADSWFSEEPLPLAYIAPSAAKVRDSGAVSGKSVDRAPVEQYLRGWISPVPSPERSKKHSVWAACGELLVGVG